MMGVLIDTSVFEALHNRHDARHTDALELIKDIEGGGFGSAYSSDYIFDENMTLALRRSSAANAAELGDRMMEATAMLFVSEEIFENAWEKFRKLGKLSFTDCTSLALMEAHGIEYIATFDKGFKGLAKTLGI